MKKHIIDDAKSYREIAAPLINELITTTVRAHGNEISMLGLMSSSGIAQLFLDSIEMYMDHVKHVSLHLREDLNSIEKRKKLWKYPKTSIDKVKYLEYIIQQALRADMEKSDIQLEAGAKETMLIYAYNFQLGAEGVTMKLRG